MKLKITNKGMYWGLIATFTLLYLLVAFVSTLHAIDFFKLSNIGALAVLLGIAYEVGQASVLFSILMTKNRDKFLPWLLMFLLTALQVTANVYASYKHMAIAGSNDWTYWYTSILKIFGVQGGSTETYQVIISWISGALLPIVALGMTALVAQNIKLMTEGEETPDGENDDGDELISGTTKISASDLISEVSKVRPTEDDLKDLERVLSVKDPDFKKEKTVDEIERIKKLISMDKPTETGSISDEIKSKIAPGLEVEDDAGDSPREQISKQIDKSVQVDVDVKASEDDPQHKGEIPELSEEEVSDMFKDEPLEPSGNTTPIDVTIFESPGVPMVERDTADEESPPEPSPEATSDPSPKEVVTNTNGLVDVPTKTPEEERLERIREIARTKKKYRT